MHYRQGMSGRLSDSAEARGHSTPGSSISTGPRSSCYSLVRDAAEDVAFDHSVDHDAISGEVIVLAVEGSWSHLLRAGAAACSAAVAADRVAAYALLHAVFTSNLP